MVMSSWQGHITDASGDVVPGATITVQQEAIGLPPAACFADKDGVTPLGDSFFADGEGYVRFYAAGGFYRITATSGAFERVWQDVPIGTAAAADVESLVPPGPRRLRLTADTTFTVGSGQQFETLQSAWDHVCKNLDLVGFDVTIQLANGTHLGGLDDHSPGEESYDYKGDGVSPVGGGKVRVVGNVGSPSSVVVDCSLFGVRVAHSYIEVHGFRLHSPGGTGLGLGAAWNGNIIIGDAMVFGDADEHIHVSSGGHVNLAEDSAGYTVDGDAGRHWFVHSGGQLRVGGATMTLTGTPAFSQAFCICAEGGLAEVGGWTFSGAATGPRFLCNNGGARISTFTNNLNYLPGSTSGVLGPGADYDDYVGPLAVTLAANALFPAANSVTINNIPTWARKLVLNIDALSSGTESRYPKIQLSDNNGSTWLTTGYSVAAFDAIGLTFEGSNDSIVSALKPVAAARSWNMRVVIEGLGPGGVPCSNFSALTDDVSVAINQGVGFHRGTGNRINAIRILLNDTGNFDFGSHSVNALP